MSYHLFSQFPCRNIGSTVLNVLFSEIRVKYEVSSACLAQKKANFSVVCSLTRFFKFCTSSKILLRVKVRDLPGNNKSIFLEQICIGRCVGLVVPERGEAELSIAANFRTSDVAKV